MTEVMQEEKEDLLLIPILSKRLVVAGFCTRFSRTKWTTKQLAFACPWNCEVPHAFGAMASKVKINRIPEYIRHRPS
jgi:hypothetical protein